MALGVLTKGLIALAFPGGAAFFYLAADRRMAALARVPVGVGAGVISADRRAVAHSGGIAKYGRRGRSRILLVLFRQRTFSAISGAGAIRGITTSFPGRFIGRCIWCGCFRGVCICRRRSARSWTNARVGRALILAARTRLLCWILAGVVLIFFAISTNQEYYTFPGVLSLADACWRMELRGANGVIAQRACARDGSGFRRECWR